MKSTIIILIFCCVITFAQRSPYAGSRPAGTYDSFIPSTTTGNPNVANRNDLSGSEAPVTQRLPNQVNGDVGYYHYLLSLPKDQQPFWLINHQQIEAHNSQPNIQISPVARKSHFAG